MAQASLALEVEPTTWEEAIRLGSRNVRLTERLLSRPWLFPFPLPVDDLQADAGGDQETGQDGEFTELTILGLYWGSAPPSQPPHSILLALPEIAASGVDGSTTATVPCLDSSGAHVGDTNCAVLIASAAYVGKFLCESSPLDAHVIAFMEEVPGCLPIAAQLFVDAHIPAAAEVGTWLYVDEQSAVRVRAQGVTAEEMYMSAPEAEDADVAALGVVQPWLGESAAFMPARRGRQRRPSIVGLGSSAKQLAAMLYRPMPKKAPTPAKSKAPAPASVHADPMLQQILSAVAEIGTRVSALEQHRVQQPQQHPSQSAACAAVPSMAPLPKAPSDSLMSKGSAWAPPAVANPWSSCCPPVCGANAAGFLPCRATGGSSILSTGGAQGSYQQALSEAQRLLGIAPPGPPPAAPAPMAGNGRQIPSGLPPGPSGGSAKAQDRESRVDADLRAAVLRGGDDSH
eukprot:6456763-Amphidinium_carterae.2